MFGKVTVKITESEEAVTKRFKEAAEKGIDPKAVVGFKEIEEHKNDSIRNASLYTVVKAMCMELVKRGYKVSVYRAEFNKHEANELEIYVSPSGGYITLRTNVKYSYAQSWRHCALMNYNRYFYEKPEKLCQTILHFPSLLIEASDTTPSTPPPEWLMICAYVFRRYWRTISVYEWVNEYPEAKRYINAMF